MNERLYRSREERMLAGVAGGIAERFDLDPSLVRVLWVVLAFVTGGLFVLLYIAMAVLVPEAPRGAGGWPAWGTPGYAREAPSPAEARPTRLPARRRAAPLRARRRRDDTPPGSRRPRRQILRRVTPPRRRTSR